MNYDEATPVPNYAAAIVTTDDLLAFSAQSAS